MDEIHPFLTAMVNATVTMKESEVRSQGESSSLDAVLIMSRGGAPAVGVLVGMAKTRDDLLSAVELAITVYQPDAAVITSEGYMPTLLTDEEFDEFERRYQYGSLHDRYEAGDPEVLRTLVACAAIRDPNMMSTAVMPYSVTGRKIVWGEFEYRSHEHDDMGDIPEVLNRAMRREINAPTDIDATELLRAAMVSVHIPMVDAVHAAKVRRNSPCPCGSGRKYKACHGNPN